MFLIFCKFFVFFVCDALIEVCVSFCLCLQGVGLVNFCVTVVGELVTELVAYLLCCDAVGLPRSCAEKGKKETYLADGVVAHDGYQVLAHGLELFVRHAVVGGQVLVQVSSELCSDEHSDCRSTEDHGGLVKGRVACGPRFDGLLKCLCGFSRMAPGCEVGRAVPPLRPQGYILRGQTSQCLFRASLVDGLL